MTRGYLDRPGCRVYYEVAGSGPLLVFAHGLGGNHLSWWQQVPHFRDRYTCVTFAHRGFAPSSSLPDGPDPVDYAGDVAALIDHLGASDVRIVAQSMGGWSAVEYALSAPARVRLRCSAIRSRCRAGSGPRPPPRPRCRPATSTWRPASAWRASSLPRTLLYQEIDALSGIDKLKLRQRLATGPTHPAELLRTLDVPTLWLTGAEDVVYPPFLSAILARMMPNAEVAQVEKAGHSVYFERPAEFNRIVDAFLTRHA